jgi:hypothetical protein
VSPGPRGHTGGAEGRRTAGIRWIDLYRYGAGEIAVRRYMPATALIHLSEHHGDGTPGSVVWIAVDDIHGLHAELAAKDYRYAKPGAPEDGPGGPGFDLIDPSGNTLRFAHSD